ncbi:MAG: RsmE family RNA methyltransferase, partial [Myxococcales bacterium]|nr:RsmE family RNA methyltransferase [Myxococcales bacterium]
MTRRLHHAPLADEGGSVTLDEAARRHARVLRLAAGAEVVLFDGAGGEADARIVEVKERLVCEVGPRRAVPGPPQRVVLVYCMPKGNAKLDLAIRGATEVGVAAIHLAISARSVARPSAEAFAKRLDRLERIAQEAARQSGRAAVPD